VAQVMLRVWREAYAGVLPPEVLAGLDHAELATAWEASIADPSGAVLVALDGARVVGFAALAPAGDPDLFGAPELRTLLVLPEERRHGHGSRLLAASAEAWREAGAALAACWVLDADTVLRDFLERAGWGRDGARRVLSTGHAEVGVSRLHTDLS